MKETYKNHIAIVFDKSWSMSNLINQATQIFNKQIEFLRNKSLQFEQETRVSFYSFSDRVECLINDVDVARPMELGNVRADGRTALLDAIALAIDDFKEIPQKYGDHSFMVYVITDGGENESRKYSPATFRRLIGSLPNNFTVAAFVPDLNSVDLMVAYGLPKGNVEKWDVTKRGLEEVGEKISQSMDNYFTARQSGQRASTTIFSDLKNVKSSEVQSILSTLNPAEYKIVINESVKAVQIKALVEAKTGEYYSVGSGFYELVKTEHIQRNKKIVIQNKKDGKVYFGDNARKLLKLPDMEVKVKPEDYGEWIVYVQSTSHNRNIIPKQRVLISEAVVYATA